MYVLYREGRGTAPNKEQQATGINIVASTFPEGHSGT